MAVGAQKNGSQKIASRLRSLRAERGNPSQKTVAKAMGVAPRSYQNWELGRATPTHTNAQKIAAYYATSTEYVLHGLDSSVSAPAARVELAEISDKLDRILRILTASSADQIMDALHAALTVDVPPPPAVQGSPSSSQSAPAKDRRPA